MALVSYRLPLAGALALALAVLALPSQHAVADDAAFVGRWTVPSHEQQKFRMAPQCKQYSETDVQTVPDSEVEMFPCDDPAHAADKARIIAFVKGVNQVYRAQGRPPYSENVSGLCAVVRVSKAKRQTDLCNPAESLRQEPIVNLPVAWNIRPSSNSEWPLAGDSYSPSSGYGAVSCFKKPAGGKVSFKGCRRWGIELPVIGAEPCDCGCSPLVCDEYTWVKK